MLSDLDEEVLVELSRSLSTETFSKDQFLFHEGDAGGRFYILVRGTVEIAKLTAGARRGGWKFCRMETCSANRRC